MLWLAVLLALRPAARLWPAFGAVVGVGLETKYTLGVVVVLLLLAFALLRRDALDVRGLAVAAAVALAIVLPNLG